jgi:hypothetical protein
MRAQFEIRGNQPIQINIRQNQNCTVLSNTAETFYFIKPTTKHSNNFAFTTKCQIHNEKYVYGKNKQTGIFKLRKISKNFYY